MAPLGAVQAPVAQLHPAPPLQVLELPFELSLIPWQVEPVPHCASLLHVHSEWPLFVYQFPPAPVQAPLLPSEGRLEQPSESTFDVSRLLQLARLPHMLPVHSQSPLRVPPDESHVAPPVQLPIWVGAWPSCPTSQQPIPSVAPLHWLFWPHAPEARH